MIKLGTRFHCTFEYHPFLGLVPHPPFLSTLTCRFPRLQKYDLGPCQYTHSQPARNSYSEVCTDVDYGYEALLARKLRSIVRECDRRIEMNQRRVDENEREKTRLKPEDEAIASLSAKYDALMENGELDEASKIETQIEEIKTKKAAAAAAAESAQGPNTESSAAVGQMLATLGNHPQYQALRVCDQCGLLLSAKEDTKLDDHFEGKLHTGYVQIRDKLGEVEKTLDEERDGDREEHKNGRNRDGGEEKSQMEVDAAKQSDDPSAAAPTSEDAKLAVTSEAAEKDPQATEETAKDDSSEKKQEDDLSPSETKPETEKGENTEEKPTEEKSSEAAAQEVVPEKPKRKKRSRAAEYENELPEPPSRQRDREKPRYGDSRDKEYERDRDRDRYGGKDRFRGRGGGGGGGYRDNYNDRRGGGSYRDRDNSHREGDRGRDNHGSYRDRDSDRYRDSYRDRY